MSMFDSVGRAGCVSGPACLRLQGVPVGGLALPATEKDMRELAGNAMSLCVVEQLLRAALVAVGVNGNSLPDRWRDGSAQGGAVQSSLQHTHPPTLHTVITICFVWGACD